MDELEKIAREIEDAREDLHRLALRKNCVFDDPEIIQLSEKLDVLIIQYERCETKQTEKDDDEPVE